MQKGIFSMDMLDGIAALEGWTDGTLWNGWATPCFELAEAQKLVGAMQETGQKAWYDEAKDSFCFQVEGYDEPECYPSLTIQTDEGELKVYAIGAFAWTWEEYEEAALP